MSEIYARDHQMAASPMLRQSYASDNQFTASPTLRRSGGPDPDDIFAPTSAQPRESIASSARSGQYRAPTASDPDRAEGAMDLRGWADVGAKMSSGSGPPLCQSVYEAVN
ncbi:hypothetical protein E4U49_005537 [Claviceps purpurea]|nr:hypothetical protein E4U49_005537 [Claviceps purpurea]